MTRLIPRVYIVAREDTAEAAVGRDHAGMDGAAVGRGDAVVGVAAVGRNDAVVDVAAVGRYGAAMDVAAATTLESLRGTTAGFKEYYIGDRKNRNRTFMLRFTLYSKQIQYLLNCIC